MALKWRDEDIKEFFGCDELCVREPKAGIQIMELDYSGRLLKYSIWLLITDESVLISGDDSHPLGGNAIFELGVPCDTNRE